MASNVEICNLALSHLGVGKEIANITTETSAEALACKRFFTVARDATLRDFAWPFATKIAALALIEEDPNDEWAYSYRYPSDCVDIRRILSGSRNDSRDTRVPYKIAKDNGGLLIYSDFEEAEMEYTVRMDDVQFYPADFSLALSFRLAAYIAPRLTKGDPFKMGERALRMYQYELARAQNTALNEEQADQEPDSEFIRVRS